MQLNKDVNGLIKTSLSTEGISLSLLEEYVSDSIKTDRQLFESIKEYLSPEQRFQREQQLINVGIFLSIIRSS